MQGAPFMLTFGLSAVIREGGSADLFITGENSKCYHRPFLSCSVRLQETKEANTKPLFFPPTAVPKLLSVNTCIEFQSRITSRPRSLVDILVPSFTKQRWSFATSWNRSFNCKMPTVSCPFERFYLFYLKSTQLWFSVMTQPGGGWGGALKSIEISFR